MSSAGPQPASTLRDLRVATLVCRFAICSRPQILRLDLKERSRTGNPRSISLQMKESIETIGAEEQTAGIGIISSGLKYISMCMQSVFLLLWSDSEMGRAVEQGLTLCIDISANERARNCVAGTSACVGTRVLRLYKYLNTETYR